MIFINEAVSLLRISPEISLTLFQLFFRKFLLTRILVKPGQENFMDSAQKSVVVR